VYATPYLEKALCCEGSALDTCVELMLAPLALFTLDVTRVTKNLADSTVAL
jgi:hypothetical protein